MAPRTTSRVAITSSAVPESVTVSSGQLLFVLNATVGAGLAAVVRMLAERSPVCPPAQADVRPSVSAAKPKYVEELKSHGW